MSDTEHESHERASAADVASWDAAADRYASMVGGSGDRIFSMLRPALWDSLGHDLRGLEILDLGCGHGWLSALMADAGARVRGIDGSRALLAHARRTVPQVEFLQCNLATDPLPTDRQYDRIVAHMVLMDLPDIDRTLAFVRSALASQARFVFTMPHPCFFNYKTRLDPDSGELYCGVTNYLQSAEWWVETYGGHRHYHRSLSIYFDALNRHSLAVTRVYEPPQVSRDPDSARAAFYRGIPKFILIEARACDGDA
jgi:SAM-dependent methyltransferase